MNKPAVSILLSVYNGEAYLKECIDSVLAQGFSDFELLIADNASTDSTAGIIRGFSDSRIRFFQRSVNLGLFQNLNLLIKEARSPIVRFLCDDDLLEPDCLGREVEFFAQHPDVAMVFCKATEIDESGKTLSLWELNDMPDEVAPFKVQQLFFYSGCIAGNLSTVSVRRPAFDECGLFDATKQFAADFDMWVRLSEKHDLGVVHQRLVRLRVHPGRLSFSEDSRLNFILDERPLLLKLMRAMPQKLFFYSRAYFIFHYDVTHVHRAMRLLLAGRFGEALRIVRVMGAWHFFAGLLAWLLTLNRHLWKLPMRIICAAGLLCYNTGA